MTQWGPADFGLSRGQPRLMSTPEILPFEELVIERSLAYGVQPRIEIAEVEEAKRYIQQGVRHFCIGWDRFIYKAGCSGSARACAGWSRPSDMRPGSPRRRLRARA